MPPVRHLTLFLVLGAALAVSGCSRDGKESRAAALDAAGQAAPASTTDAGTTATAEPPATAPSDAPEGEGGYVTFLAAIHDVEVFARAPGTVRAVQGVEGRRVAAGTPLAQIEDDAQRLALAEREAQLDAAQSAFTRAEGLHARKLLPESDYLEARAAVRIARARRDQARLDVERCVVRAPIGGIVALNRAQVGQTVQTGALLFRVTDPDHLRAELLVPQEEMGRIRHGQQVTLTPLAGGGPVTARVTRVTPTVDAASGTFRVAIELDNRRTRLPAGVSARCTFGGTAAARRS